VAPYPRSHGVSCMWLSAKEAEIGKDLQEKGLYFYFSMPGIHRYCGNIITVLEVGLKLLKIPFKSRRISMDKAKIWFQIRQYTLNHSFGDCLSHQTISGLASKSKPHLVLLPRSSPNIHFFTNFWTRHCHAFVLDHEMK